MLRRIHNLSMSTKIGLMAIVGLTILGSVIVSVTVMTLNESLIKQAEQRMAINVKVARAMLEQYGTDFSVKDEKLYIGDHVLNGDFDSVDKVTKLVGGVSTIFMGDVRVTTNIIKNDGKRAVGTKLAAGPAYDSALGKGKLFYGEADILGESYLVAYDPIKNGNGDTIGIIFVGLKKTEQMAVIGKLISHIVILSLVVGLIIAGGIYFVIRRQLKPLNRLEEVMERLQDDDTSVDIPAQERGDEIGRIAHTVQRFKEGIVEKLRLREEQELGKKKAEAERRELMSRLADDFEQSVHGIVSTVSSAATEMQHSAGSMAAIAEESAKKATTGAGAAQQASVNVQMVASAAEELNASIGEISRQIAESARVAATCAAEAEATGAVMQGLSKAAEDIGNVVKLIDDIANQVNLLALNATIEAARAGEAGRGFAVVATEVKNLANQAGSAAQDITKQIANIQEQTANAVKTINGITSTIKQVSQISTTIASAIEEQGAATKEISRSIDEASHDTNVVTQNIADITHAAEETGTASTQVLQTADQLARESDSLRQAVEGFIVKVRAG